MLVVADGGLIGIVFSGLVSNLVDREVVGLLGGNLGISLMDSRDSGLLLGSILGSGHSGGIDDHRGLRLGGMDLAVDLAINSLVVLQIHSLSALSAFEASLVEGALSDSQIEGVAFQRISTLLADFTLLGGHF